MAVTMKNGVFWDVMPCGSNTFGGKYRLHRQGEKNQFHLLLFLFTVNVVLNALILSTLMTEAIRSSETSNFTRNIQRHILEDGILRWEISLWNSNN
jgi:hypothetical protein